MSTSTPSGTPRAHKSSSKPQAAGTATQTQTQTVPAAVQAQGLLPPAHPTQTLSTPLARAISHTHTLAVPLLFAARFSAIVADPVAGLATSLLPLALLQGAYCVLSLPPTTEGGATNSAADKSASSSASAVAAAAAARRKHGERGGAGKDKGGAFKIGGRVVPALLSLILATLVTPLLLALVILHGAPLTTHIPHTALLALHLSLLATAPLFYTSGVQSIAWRQIVSLSAPFDEVRGAAAGAAVGAWLGAIPIPLDWDRDWQRWPCTVVAGVYAGWMVGKVLGGTVGYGRIINFE